jgi:hypothetical protein
VPGGEERIRPVRGIGYFYAVTTRVSQ